MPASQLPPGPASPEVPTLELSLQSPGPPFTPEDSSTPKPTARIVMIRHGATYSTEDGLLLGRKDEALTPLGEVQANKTAELLMDMKVGNQQKGGTTKSMLGAAQQTAWHNRKRAHRQGRRLWHAPDIKGRGGTGPLCKGDDCPKLHCMESQSLSARDLRGRHELAVSCVNRACLLQIDALFSSPLKRSADTARVISKLQSLTGFGATPFVQQLEELTERDFGDWEGEPTARVRSPSGGCKACLMGHGRDNRHTAAHFTQAMRAQNPELLVCVSPVVHLPRLQS